MTRAGLLGAAAVVFSIAAGCGAPSRRSSAPAPDAPVVAAPAASDLPLADEAPQPAPAATGPEVKIKLIADANRKAHVFWGRKDLGVAPLEIRRPRGSGPLDLLFVAPGFLPLHTRVFTDHDDTLSVRLYDEDAANGLLGYPIRSGAKTDFPHAR